MTPLILLGTFIHTSLRIRGREGQRFKQELRLPIAQKLLRLNDKDPDSFDVGISAGFASVFGTPWQGCICIEVLAIGRISYVAIAPAF